MGDVLEYITFNYSENSGKWILFVTRKSMYSKLRGMLVLEDEYCHIEQHNSICEMGILTKTT